MKNASVKGDQYITVQIQVPRTLTPEAKRKLEELAPLL
jgi:molecular chaperone DnaJ